MIALITVATSGLGRAIALKFAEHGWDVIITGRRENRREDLKHLILDTYDVKVFTLSFDVRNREAVEEELNALPHFWKEIDVLVNNAGLAAGLSTIQEGDINDWEQMIDTNVKGLLYVSRTVLPWMIARKQGHVINIGSTAGKDAYANGNVYCGTKFAVDAITKSMRIDLLPHQIKVTAVNPGAAETEFSLVRLEGNAEKAIAVYNGIEALQADDIAEIVWFAATRPAHVVLNDIVVTPLAQANAMYVHRTVWE